MVLNPYEALVFLNYRDLQGNKLGGQIPDEIGNCVSLAYV